MESPARAKMDIVDINSNSNGTVEAGIPTLSMTKETAVEKENVPSAALPQFNMGTGDSSNKSPRRSPQRQRARHQSARRRSARLAQKAHRQLAPTTNHKKQRRDIFCDEFLVTGSKKKRKVLHEDNKKKALLELQPSFAMMPVGFQQGRILDTNYGGAWEFKLGHWLSHIHQQYPNLDLYVVGYRMEERPGIGERGFRQAFPSAEEGKRINVPYFAVHGLHRDLMEPDTIVLEDIGENKMHELKKLDDLSLDWKQVATFEDSQAVVKLLVSKARTTSSAQRASILPSSHVGGRVHFPQRRKWAENHGEDFHYQGNNGEDFPFDDGIWGWTKHHVRNVITNGVSADKTKEVWRDFMKTKDTNHWVESVLPTVLDQFYIYYDEDIDRGKSEDDVRTKLRDAFTAYRSKLINDNREYMESEEALNQCKNFKIYPENTFLKMYLGKEGVNKLSQWIPGNDEVVVYPTVERIVEPKRPPLWG